MLEEVLTRVLGRVEPGDRGSVASGDDLTQQPDPHVEVGHEEAEVARVVRVVPEELHGGLGDVGQCAFVADEHVPDVGAGGASGHVLDPRDVTARQDRLQAHHHVLDPAVQGGELPDGPGGNQAAHLGDGLGLRGVPGGQALLAHMVLEYLQRHAALGGRHHVLGVDVQDAVHPRAVDDQRVLDQGLETALGAGAPGPGDDGDALTLGVREDVRNLLGGDRVDDRGRERPVVDAVHRGVLTEAVDAALLEPGRVGIDLVGAEHLRDGAHDLFAARARSGDDHEMWPFLGW